MKTLTYALPVRTGSNLNGNGTFVSEVAMLTSAFANNIGTTTDKVRVFKGMDVEIWAAADDYATYINVSQRLRVLFKRNPCLPTSMAALDCFPQELSGSKKMCS